MPTFWRSPAWIFRRFTAFCAVCEPHVLGIPLRVAAADGRASLGPAARQNIAYKTFSLGFSHFGKVHPSHPFVGDRYRGRENSPTCPYCYIAEDWMRD